jgi:hypothetical protein
MDKILMKRILFAVLLLIGLAACKKGPGEGGNSSIRGYIQVVKLNSFLTDTLAIYGGYDEDVYIIYGDEITFGDRTRSNYDGKFEFKYLREGSYKIYVYSQDTLPPGVLDTIPGKYVVLKNVEITKSDQEVDAGTFVIKKH